jgi:ArsR family transcriptional regulator
MKPDDADGAPRVVSDELFKDFTTLFKLLSDETRLRILVLLSEGDELHVRELCGKLGQSQPAVSHHLALLRLAGLVEQRREGKYNFYRINSQRFHELFDTFFSAVPQSDHKVRFDDYVFSFAPEASCK